MWGRGGGKSLSIEWNPANTEHVLAKKKEPPGHDLRSPCINSYGLFACHKVTQKLIHSETILYCAHSYGS